MKPHIAILLPHASRGGIERTCVNLIRQIHADARVTLLVYDRPPQPAPEEGHATLVHLKPRIPLPLAPARLRRAASALLPLARYLRREQPHMLLAFQAPLLAAAAAGLSGTQATLVARESNSLQALRGNPLVRRIKLALKRRAYRRADIVVALCREMAEELSGKLGIPPAKLRVIYNPVSAAAISDAARERPRHPWYDEVKETPVIAAAGRLEHQKDFPTLLRAFAAVRRRRPCRLVLMGSGRQRQTLERLIRELGIKDHAWLPGHLENPHAHIAHATLFALSSRYEGLANSIIEAQACGVPVAAAACPTSPREILLDGKAGILVPVGDPDALAAAMERYLEDPALRKRHAAAGTRELTRFDVDKSIAAYMQMALEARP